MCSLSYLLVRHFTRVAQKKWKKRLDINVRYRIFYTRTYHTFHVEFGSSCFYIALAFLEYILNIKEFFWNRNKLCGECDLAPIPSDSHPHIELVAGNRITRITFEDRVRISNSNWAGRWHEDAHCRENDQWFLFKLNLWMPATNEKVCEPYKNLWLDNDRECHKTEQRTHSKTYNCYKTRIVSSFFFV